MPRSGSPLNRLLTLHAYAARRLREKAGSLAWPAYERLVSNAAVTNPVPPDPRDDLAWATFPMATEFAEAVDEPTLKVRTTLKRSVLTTCMRRSLPTPSSSMRSCDSELAKRVHEWPLFIDTRHAAKPFDDERLRDACDKEPSRAERLLTLDLARYLFDAGLPPLIDANAGGLRPDVLHVLPRRSSPWMRSSTRTSTLARK